MSALQTGSLCTGYAGLDEAVRSVLGGDLAWVADIDPGAAAILAHRFPSVPNLGDIAAVDWSSVAPVDVLTAGFPCFAAGTRILTASGWLPIEDVRIGDLALTHAGRWRPVTGVMSRVSDHSVTVRGQGVPQIMTTEEHPFYARTYRREWRHRQPGGRPRVFGAPEWVEAAKLAGQFIGQVLPPVEDAEGSEDLWWLVGRYLADGWTTTGKRGRNRNRVVICCADREADELAERIGRVVHATRSQALTATNFVITRAWFVDFLVPLGRGAAGKTLTRRELALPQGKAEALLAGWLSGDGCRTQDAWKGTTVSRSLALSMALLAQRARDVVASLNETAVPSSTVIAGRAVGQRTQYQVVIRDRNRSAITEGDYGWKLVRSAERVESPALVYNLSVAEDESYVADGAIVHNCQDVSCAGARAGLRDGNRTGVWSYVARAIGELRPSLVVLENVRGLLSAGADSDMEPCPWCLGETGDEHALRAAGAVLGDLANLGFDAEWTVVSAADAGAPHRRERVFILAWSAKDAYGTARGERRIPAPRQAEGGRPRADAGGPGGAPASDADRNGQPGRTPGGPGETGLDCGMWLRRSCRRRRERTGTGRVRPMRGGT